jgi:peptide/nickel transport system substrate-binding protein
MDAAIYGRGNAMFGGPAKVTSPVWPQPSPYNTDMAKAKRLLTEAGFPNGFETTLSFDLGAAVVNEPICELVQESLGQIGIKVSLNKVPGANWRAELIKKTFPMVLNLFGGWLNFPEYFFFWNYHSQNSLYNSMNYQNPVMDKLIETARFESDPKKYKEDVEDFITLAFTEMPRIPLFQPSIDVVMQKNVTGYRYWFHRQLDYRQLAKA